MRKKYICENTGCEQFEIEFVLTDPMPTTTCGGCGQVLIGIEIE
jgi:hypothetical protein